MTSRSCIIRCLRADTSYTRAIASSLFMSFVSRFGCIRSIRTSFSVMRVCDPAPCSLSYDEWILFTSANSFTDKSISKPIDRVVDRSINILYRACKLFNIRLYATLCLNSSGDIVVRFHTAVCLSCIICWLCSDRYWANYTQGKTKFSRKSENAVADDQVLKFLYDADLCHVESSVRCHRKYKNGGIKVDLE